MTTTVPSVIVQAAVLHVLLTRHPELEHFPIEWLIGERHGIEAYLRPETDPGLSQRAGEMLADILQADLHADEIRCAGIDWALIHSISCSLHGSPFRFSARSPLHGPAPAPAAA